MIGSSKRREQMGANLCCRSKSSLEQVPKHGSHDHLLYLRTSIIELMNAGCLKIENKKRQLSPDQPQMKKITKMRELTLEDYILASPGMKRDRIQGGELLVFRHARSVYQSSTRDHAHNVTSRPSKSSFPIKGVKVDEGDKGDIVVSSLSGNQRRKLKKKKVKKITKVRKLTLEDYILASPGMKQDYMNRGELHVFGTSSRVYPTTSRFQAHIVSRPKDSSSLEGNVKVAGNKEGLAVSSFNRREGGKLKKKVCFKEPDIIIYYSPDEKSGC